MWIIASGNDRGLSLDFARDEQNKPQLLKATFSKSRALKGRSQFVGDEIV